MNTKDLGPAGSDSSEGLGGWRPVTEVPAFTHRTLGVSECRDLLVWIDEPHTKGFARGYCAQYPGMPRPEFRAEGHNGQWNITHWMPIAPPNAA